MSSLNRASWVQIAAFAIVGIAYVALYAVAFVINAVASLGGGPKNLEVIVGFGLLAALAGTLVGGVTLLISRHITRSARWLGVLGSWIVWVIAAGASTPVVERFWETSGPLYALVFVPPAVTLLASVFGIIMTLRAAHGAAPAK
jgi:hypothetical protein